MIKSKKQPIDRIIYYSDLKFSIWEAPWTDPLPEVTISDTWRPSKEQVAVCFQKLETRLKKFERK